MTRLYKEYLIYRDSPKTFLKSSGEISYSLRKEVGFSKDLKEETLERGVLNMHYIKNRILEKVKELPTALFTRKNYNVQEEVVIYKDDNSNLQFEVVGAFEEIFLFNTSIEGVLLIQNYKDDGVKNWVVQLNFKDEKTDFIRLAIVAGQLCQIKEQQDTNAKEEVIIMNQEKIINAIKALEEKIDTVLDINPLKEKINAVDKAHEALEAKIDLLLNAFSSKSTAKEIHKISKYPLFFTRNEDTFSLLQTEPDDEIIEELSVDQIDGYSFEYTITVTFNVSDVIGEHSFDIKKTNDHSKWNFYKAMPIDLSVTDLEDGFILTIVMTAKDKDSEKKFAFFPYWIKSIDQLKQISITNTGKGFTLLSGKTVYDDNY